MNYSTIPHKMKYIEEILTRLENKESVSIIDILKGELDTLRQQVVEERNTDEGKMVVGKEENGIKTRYYLKDGSVYVVKGKDYRYLYDSKTKIVTYEFENGQIERTFENGLKEIRKKDGTIIVKTGPKDYEFV